MEVSLFFSNFCCNESNFQFYEVKLEVKHMLALILSNKLMDESFSLKYFLNFCSNEVKHKPQLKPKKPKTKEGSSKKKRKTKSKKYF